MFRTVLTNLGSLGNVQPFLALAAELRRSNHHPVLAVAPQYEVYVRKLGFEFIPIGPEIDLRGLQKRDTASAMRGEDPIGIFRQSLAILSSMLPAMFSELSAACHHADILISGHLQPVSRIIHEITHIPFVSVHTNHFGKCQPRAFREAACSVINPFRAKCGVPPIKDPIHTDANSDQLALYAISRYLRPPAPEWPSHYHVTGFFFLEEEWQAEPALVEFINAGPPPVVFTFSSIVHADPRAITELLIKSIEGLGCRAVILSGWSGLGEGIRHPSVYVTQFAQHSWLFPQAACVVHASGTGTVATVLKSGVPAVPIPHVGEQPIWAELVRGIGCAKCIIPYRELTADRLRDAIAQTLKDDSLLRNAARMAVRIRNERGVVCAARLIDELLQRVNPRLESAARSSRAAPAESGLRTLPS